MAFRTSTAGMLREWADGRFSAVRCLTAIATVFRMLPRCRGTASVEMFGLVGVLDVGRRGLIGLSLVKQAGLVVVAGM
ncbi:hypothetical protein [Amycolatopsis sp. NPDC004079]|uniref:hypothetical protein n=1 Tax=Amycolatopsis sp. NPDC004079 TaxID=3154549 RepID=UPI0033B071BB